MSRTTYIFLASLALLTLFGYKLSSYVYKNHMDLPVYNVDKRIDDFQFQNQLDQVFDSKDHNSKIWVLNYFFTSCPIVCPKIMRNMQEVHNIMRHQDDVVMLSFTCDPKRDKPEKFQQYLQNYNIDHDKWFLLTGDKRELYRLARKSFLISATDGPGDESDFIHSENIVIIDKNKSIRAFINGTDPDADRKILEIISALKVEK